MNQPPCHEEARKLDRKISYLWTPLFPSTEKVWRWLKIFMENKKIMYGKIAH